jgi:MarR family transcriptional regulator, organic hydroperoxide resistance regulator
MNYNNPEVKQAAEVVQSFMKISGVLTKFTLQNAESLGLTVQQMGILNIISAFPEITHKAITEKLNLPKSTVSVTIDSLVDLELIDRRITEDNRREIHLTSTPKGKELSQRSSQNALSYRAMILALEQIPEQDVQSLIRTHKALLTRLQDCKF